MTPGECHQVSRSNFPATTRRSKTLERAGLKPPSNLLLADAQSFGRLWRRDSLDMPNEDRVRWLEVGNRRRRRRYRRILLPLPVRFLDIGPEAGAITGPAQKTLRFPRSAVVVKMVSPEFAQLGNFSVERREEPAKRGVDRGWLRKHSGCAAGYFFRLRGVSW